MIALRRNPSWRASARLEGKAQARCQPTVENGIPQRPVDLERLVAGARIELQGNVQQFPLTFQSGRHLDSIIGPIGDHFNMP
jgi:hypothetical protein